jgi:hypothetical protein
MLLQNCLKVNLENIQKDKTHVLLDTVKLEVENHLQHLEKTKGTHKANLVLVQILTGT